MKTDLIRVAVIAFCHDGKGRYLLGKRSPTVQDEQGKWEPAAGGGLKFGEMIEDAARREVREETGAEVEHLEFLGYRDVHRIQEGRQTHWIALDFRARIDPAKVVIGEPHKCTEQRWVTLGEIKNFEEELHSQFPFFLERYRSRLTS